MREAMILVLTGLVGAGVGFGYYQVRYGNEDNRLDVYKDIGALPAANVEAGAKPPQAVVVDGPDFDFGTMEKNEERSHTFTIRNDGEMPLQIKLLETSCKCTLAEIDENEIPPGGTKEVTLTWKPETYAESFSQNARIQTNDPQKRMLELRVTGRVSVPVRPVPETLVVSDILSGDGFAESIDIYAYKADDLAVVDLAWQNPQHADRYDLSVESLPADAQPFEDDPSLRSAVRVTVTGKPGLPLGPLRDMLVITTNQGAVGPLEIPVLGRVRGNYQFDTLRRAPFDASNNRLDLGTISGSQTKEVEIKLLVRGERADDVQVTVDPAEIQPAGILQAEVLEKERIGALTSFPIRIKVAGQGQGVSRLGPALEDLGKILVRTDDPEAPVIELYVKFAVTE